MEISQRTALSYERLDALCGKGRQIRSDHLSSIFLTAFSGRRAPEPRGLGVSRLLRHASGPAAPDGARLTPSAGARRFWWTGLFRRRVV